MAEETRSVDQTTETVEATMLPEDNAIASEQESQYEINTTEAEPELQADMAGMAFQKGVSKAELTVKGTPVVKSDYTPDMVKEAKVEANIVTLGEMLRFAITNSPGASFLDTVMQVAQGKEVTQDSVLQESYIEVMENYSRMKEDKTAYYQEEAKKIEEMSVPEQCVAAFVNGIADGVASTSVPEIREAFDKSGANILYTGTTIGATLATSIVPSLRMGGRFLAFAVANTLQSGVGMYEEMNGRKRVLLNELDTKIETQEALGMEVSQEEMGNILNISPATYGFIAAGASAVANTVSYGLGEVMINKVVNKYIAGELSRTIGTMASNTIENTLDFGIDLGVKNYALSSAGQETVDMNLAGLGIGMAFGLAGGYVRGRAQYKMELDAYDIELDKYLFLDGKKGRASDILLKDAPLTKHAEFTSNAEKTVMGADSAPLDKKLIDAEIESLKTYIDDTAGNMIIKRKDSTTKPAELKKMRNDIIEAQTKIEVLQRSQRVDPTDADIELGRSIKKDMEAYYENKSKETDPSLKKDGENFRIDENGEIQYLHGGFGFVTDAGTKIQNAAKEIWHNRKVDVNVTDAEVRSLTHKAVSTVRESLEDSKHLVDDDFEAIMNALGGPENKGVKNLYSRETSRRSKIASKDVRASLEELVKYHIKQNYPDLSPAGIDKKISEMVGKDRVYESAISLYSSSFPRNGSDAEIARYSDDFIDALNIPDPLVKNEMKKALREQGWIAPDDFDTINATAGKMKTAIDETMRFETVADVYHNLRMVSEAAGMKPMEPFIDVTNGKTRLSKKEANQLMSKYMNMEEKLRTSFHNTMAEYNEFFRTANSYLAGSNMTTLNQKISRSALASIDPHYRALSTKLYDNVRVWGKGSGWVKTKFQQFMLGDTADRGLLPFLKEHKISKDMTNIVRYLDEIDNLQAMNKLELEEGTVMGIYNMKYPKSVAQKLGLSDAEIVAAHKISNNMNDMYRIYTDSRAAKVPYDTMGEISKMKSFGETSANFEGNAYFPRVIDDAKAKELIQFGGGLAEDRIIKSTFTKGRKTNSSLSGETKGRLPHLQELENVYGRMGNKMFYDPIFDNMMEMGVRTFGIQAMKKQNIKNLQDLEVFASKFAADNKQNKQAKYFSDLLEHYNTIFKPVKEPELIEKVLRTVLSPMMRVFTNVVLSPLRVPYQTSNLLQVYNNMSMYTGYLNTAKSIPSGIKSVVDFVTKNEWSIRNRVKDIDKQLQSGNLTKEAAELLDVRKTYFTRHFDPGQETGHWSFKDGMDLGITTEGIGSNPILWQWGDGMMNDKVVRGVNYMKRMLTTANTVSDLASREWGLNASLMRFKEFEKRFNGRSIDNIEDLSRHLQEARKFLGLDGLEIVPQQKMNALLTKWFDGNDIKVLRDEYIYQMIDSGLYHYDAANRHGVYDKAKHSTIVVQAMTRFTSWPMYDMALHGRIYRDARNGNYFPLIRTVGALAAGIGVKYWLDEYVSKNNKAAKFIKKVGFDRAKGVSVIGAAGSKYKHPLGLVGLLTDIGFLVQGGREGRVVKKKWLNLFAVPDTKDAKGLIRGGKRTARDLGRFVEDVRQFMNKEDLEEFNNVLEPFEAEGLILYNDN